MTFKMKPQVGDALFYEKKRIKSKASGLIQRIIDPSARKSDRTFEHVALTLSDTLALEAMPEDENKDQEKFTLPHTVELGKWTKSELRAGVRLVPIPDFVVPVMGNENQFIALRPPRGREPAPEVLSPASQFVLNLVGSEYSLEVLKQRSAEVFGPHLTWLVGSTKSDWTSMPNDLGTRLDLSPDLRNQISTTLPNFKLVDVPRTYYCSQLVIAGLTEANSLSQEGPSEATTPTGLYKILLDQNWEDVSEAYRCSPDADRYHHMSPTGYAASYTTWLAILEVAMRQSAVNETYNVLEAMMDRANHFLEGVLTELEAARSKGTEL